MVENREMKHCLALCHSSPDHCERKIRLILPNIHTWIVQILSAQFTSWRRVVYWIAYESASKKGVTLIKPFLSKTAFLDIFFPSIISLKLPPPCVFVCPLFPIYFVEKTFIFYFILLLIIWTYNFILMRINNYFISNITNKKYTFFFIYFWNPP